MSTTVDIVSDAGYLVQGQGSSYSAARSTSNTSSAWSANTFGQGEWGGSLWRCWRFFMRFDTSIIGADKVVTNVKLGMNTYVNNSTIDFDVQVCMQNWSGQDPIVADNRETAFDNCLAESNYDTWLNTSSLSGNKQYIGNDMTTAWINKTGYTYYSLRSSRDYAGTARALGDPSEEIGLRGPSDGIAAYRPVLIVTYEEGAPPPSKAKPLYQVGRMNSSYRVGRIN